MKHFKIVPIPSKSGLRQPIHADQLAEVIYFLMINSLKAKTKVSKNKMNSADNLLIDAITNLENEV